MDIFKLIYENDLRLDALRERHNDRNTPEVSSSIEDFLKPDPTYSKYYITGTRLTEGVFGLNKLAQFNNITDALNRVVVKDSGNTLSGSFKKLDDFIRDAGIGNAVIIGHSKAQPVDPQELFIDDNSNVGHKKEKLAEVLSGGSKVLYKERAKDGFDLHLFSGDNIYQQLFYPLQKLVSPEFRFFSMNGKRITSERKFYFETWTLNRPPHGAEEVFPETVL